MVEWIKKSWYIYKDKELGGSENAQNGAAESSVGEP